MPSHYLNQYCLIVNCTFRNKLQWNFNQNTKLSIHENAYENIFCEKAAILSRGRWVNTQRLTDMATSLQIILCWFFWKLYRIFHWLNYRTYLVAWSKMSGCENTFKSISCKFDKFTNNQLPFFTGCKHLLACVIDMLCNKITHTIESYWIPSQQKTKSKLQF